MGFFLAFLGVCFVLQGSRTHDIDECDNRPKDIVFILDASSSIWPVDFMTQLNFLRNLTRTFNIGPSVTQTRVGVVTFSSTWKVEFNLKDRMNKEDLAKAISRVRHLTGGTNTADAINFVADNMYLLKYGGRKNSSKIAIVITDGESYYKDKTAVASEKLRSKGVTVFAIGVGDRVDIDELNSIGSKPTEKHVLEVFSYKNLQKIQDILTKRACEAIFTTTTIQPTTTSRETTTTPTTEATRTTQPTTTTKATTTTQATTTTKATTTTESTTPKTTTQKPQTTTNENLPGLSDIQADKERITQSCGGKPADVFFLLDASGSIRPSDFKLQLDFVSIIVEMFDISQDRTRVGISTFSHQYNPVFGLDRYKDKASLMTAINSVPYSGGGTNTGNAIKQLREREFSRQFTRPSVAHIVIVVTDGLSQFPLETAKEAAKLKKYGTYVFAVGVGDNIDHEEMSNIASPPDNRVNKYAHHVSSFDSLKTLRNILAIETCDIAGFQRDERVCKTSKDSDVMFVFDAAYFGYKMSHQIMNIIEQVSMYLSTTGGKITTGVHSNACLRNTTRPLSSAPLELIEDYDEISNLIADLRASQILQSNDRRVRPVKMAVVFIDENLPHRTQTEILRSKFSKINFVIVQIGSAMIDDKLRRLASKPHYAMALQDQQEDTVQYLNTVLCEGI